MQREMTAMMIGASTSMRMKWKKQTSKRTKKTKMKNLFSHQKRGRSELEKWKISVKNFLAPDAAASIMILWSNAQKEFTSQPLIFNYISHLSFPVNRLSLTILFRLIFIISSYNLTISIFKIQYLKHNSGQFFNRNHLI